MKNKTRCLEIRTSEGKVILSFYLYDKEVELEDNPGALNTGPEKVSVSAFA